MGQALPLGGLRVLSPTKAAASTSLSSAGLQPTPRPCPRPAGSPCCQDSPLEVLGQRQPIQTGCVTLGQPLPSVGSNLETQLAPLPSCFKVTCFCVPCGARRNIWEQ